MRNEIASAINGYQRYLSPWKGFCCAHNALHRRGSCSAFGKRLVLRAGVWRFLALMPLRLVACRDASRLMVATSESQPAKPLAARLEPEDKVALSCLGETAINAACCLVPLC